MSKCRILCFLLIFLVNMQLIAYELNEKEKELSEVQLLIEEQKRKIKETEEQKKTALRTKQQTQRQLNITQKKLQELNIAEQNLKKSLELTKNLLSQTESRLTNIQISCHQTMLYLALADQAETKLKQQNNESFLLSLLLKRLIIENKKLNMEKIKISSETFTKEQEFNKTINLSKTEKSKLNTITTSLKKIDTEIVSFEKQKQDYQAKADELEKSARALQDLINLLKAEAKKYQLTYEFPNGFEAPVSGKIISSFGQKKHDKYDISTFSNGVDISAPENSVISSFADGEVVYADWFTGSGRMIIIDHKNGYHTVYAYNNTLLVKKGDIVSRGQAIAKSGKSSATSPPGLRFELRKNGLPIDPSEFISKSP